MPSPNLPQDLTDLILDDLASGKREEYLPSLLSCSTVHSSFVQTCQKRIFETVTLTFPRVPYTPVDPQYELYESTMLFVEAVTYSPHLGTYVHDFTLHISDLEVGERHKDLVLAAASQLPAVKSVLIEGCIDSGKQYPPQYIILDHKTTMAISALMRRPHLRSLSLHRIKKWPVALISAAPNLEFLSLVLSSLDVDCYHDPTFKDSGAQAMGPLLKKLKHLSCDPLSLPGWINTFLRSESGRVGTQDIFSCLQSLDVRLDGYSIRDGMEDGPIPLFKQVERLRSLKFQVIDVWLQSTRTISFLRHLHPGSFSTLLDLTHNVLYLCPLSGEVINDPYYGLCNILPQLIQLQSLRINLVFQGSLKVDWTASFGPQWGQLCETVLLPGRGAELEELAVKVGIRVPSNARKDSIVDYAANAEKMRQHILASVYPAQFQPLEDLQSAGLMSFSFAVKVSVSSFINDPYDMFFVI